MTQGGAGRSLKVRTDSRSLSMSRFLAVCTEIKIVAVEIAGLLGFLALLVVVLWREWHHLLSFR
jgi:hypothetical protein